MFSICNRHETAVIAPQAVPSTTTALTPLLWCLLTPNTQLLFEQKAQAHRPLVVNDRHRQLLVAVTLILSHP